MFNTTHDAILLVIAGLCLVIALVRNRQHDIKHRIAAAAAYRQIRFGGIACVS